MNKDGKLMVPISNGLSSRFIVLALVILVSFPATAYLPDSPSGDPSIDATTDTGRAISNVQWPMFGRDSQHTANAGTFARKLTAPLLMWDSQSSIDSRGMSIGNFSDNMVLNGTGNYDRSTLHAVFSDNGQVEIVEARTGNQMWGVLLGGTLLGAPALTDFNINGRQDIVVVSSLGNISAYEPVIGWNGSAYSWNTTNNSASRLWEKALGADASYSSPVIGDISNDGIPDVALCSGHTLHVLSGYDGSSVWNATLKGNLATTPVLLDYGTAGPWVAVQSYNYSGVTLDEMYVALYDDTGSEFWTKTIPLSITIATFFMLPSPAASDLDKDGKQELVALSPFESGNGRVYPYKQDGTLLWSAFGLTGQCEASPAIGDFNNDTYPDIVTSSWNTTILGNAKTFVTAIDGKNGTELWSRTIDRVNDYLVTERAVASPAVADLDKDGRSDVVVSTLNGRIYALKGAAGAELWEYNNTARVSMISSPSIADVDLNGFPELLEDGIVLTEQIADLTISPADITISTGNPVEGANITVTALVRNNGTKSITNVSVEFADIYDNTTVWTATKGIDVAAGGSAGAMAYWTPQGGGAHTLSVYVDPKNVIEEIFENNNNASRKVSVFSHYTLSIVSFNNESYINPGEDAAYFVEIHNDGDAPNTVNLSVSGLPQGWSSTLGSARFTLQPNATNTVSVIVSSFSGAAAGAYPANVTARSESSPGNKATVVLTTFIRGRYGISLTPDVNTSNVMADVFVSYQFNVMNTGNDVDTMRFTNTSPPTDWAVIMSRTEISLQGMTEMTLTMMVKAPPYSQEGEVAVVSVTATSTGDPTKSKTATTQTVVVRPDLIVESMKFYRADGVEADGSKTHLVDGKAASINVTVKNARENVDVISVLVTVGEGNISIGQEFISLLRAGQNSSVLLFWTPSAGQHALEAAVDPDNSVLEKDETNNRLAVMTTVRTRTTTTQYVVQGTVLKQGGTPASGASVAIYNLRTNQSDTVGTNAAGFYSFDIATFVGGYDEEEKIMVTASDGMTTCSTVFLAYSDDGGRTVDFTLMPGPYDFFMAVDRQFANSEPGAQIAYKVWISNLGPNINDVLVNYTIIPSGWLGILENQNGSRASLVSVAPNSTEYIFFRITPSRTALSGTKAVVSIQGTAVNATGVKHSVETTTTVSQVYSLELVAEKGAVMKPGDTNKYNITVRNTGNGDDTFDLNLSGVPASMTASLNKTAVIIGPQSSYIVNVEVSANISIATGVYNVTVTGKSRYAMTTVENRTNLTITIEPFIFRLQLGGGIGAVMQGDYCSVNFTARNVGNVAETFSLAVGLESPTRLPAGWLYSIKKLGIDTVSVTLSANESVTLELRVIPPTEITNLSNIQFNISGTSRTDPAKVATSSIYVSIERPDIIIIGQWTIQPGEPKEGEKVKISVNVLNQGYGDAPPVRVRFYKGTLLIGEKVTGPIALNGQVPLSINWTAQKGAHTLRVVVNPDVSNPDRIKELRYDNNEVARNLVVGEPGGEVPWALIAGFLIVGVIVVAIYMVLDKKGKPKRARPSADDEEEYEEESDEEQGAEEEEGDEKSPEEEDEGGEEEDNEEELDGHDEDNSKGGPDEEEPGEERDTVESDAHEVEAVEVLEEEATKQVVKKRVVARTASAGISVGAMPKVAKPVTVRQLKKKPKKKAPPIPPAEIEMPSMIRIG